MANVLTYDQEGLLAALEERRVAAAAYDASRLAAHRKEEIAWMNAMKSSFAESAKRVKSAKTYEEARDTFFTSKKDWNGKVTLSRLEDGIVRMPPACPVSAVKPIEAAIRLVARYHKPTYRIAQGGTLGSVYSALTWESPLEVNLKGMCD